MDKPESVSAFTRKKDAANQIVESTPTKRDRHFEKPKLGGPTDMRNTIDTNTIVTPKVDVNSKLISNFGMNQDHYGHPLTERVSHWLFTFTFYRQKMVNQEEKGPQ